MSYQKHLYAIMYPNKSLVASQLEPNEFARYYSVGSNRYYSGKMLFLEVDLAYRHPYFRIDEFLAQTVEHPDGSPKHTKFISSYRVLEHLELSALGALYAVTTNGLALRMDKTADSEVPHPERVRIYQELNPVEMLVASTYGHRSFGRFMTSPENTKGAPRLFFTQLDLDVEAFLREWSRNPFMSAPLPGVHPQKLSETIKVLQGDPNPRTKSIGIQSIFGDVHYSKIKHGFWVAAGDESVFYPMPSEADLQAHHHAWWKAR